MASVALASAKGAVTRPTGVAPPLLALFRELGDLKRIRSAGADGSIAQRLFARAWSALLRGEPQGRVMEATTAAALAAARLGDLDLATLCALGLDTAQAVAVLERAFDEVSGALAPALAAQLRPALAFGAPAPGEVPDFVLRLQRQPRAGVTCPGRPRILLQPPETHAEHCLMIAVYGVVACSHEGADPAEVFLSGMAHHLHSVLMPDSGFTGEVLLGDALDGVVDRARQAVLATLPAPLQAEVRRALAPLGGDATAEARAFHVADVLDRVLEIEQHLRAAHVTMDEVLGPYGLVHDGPVAAFHAAILNDAGFQA